MEASKKQYPRREVEVTIKIKVLLTADEWVKQDQLDAVPENDIAEKVVDGLSLSAHGVTGYINEDNPWYTEDIVEMERVYEKT